MKIRLLFIVTLLAGIVSACGEKDIAVFEGRNQIYFEKFYMNALYPGTKEADTTRTSFFFFPENTKEIKVKLVVNLSGLELEKDLHFGLKTVEEGTTAKPEEYRLEKEYTFRKRALPTDMKEVKDTIEVSVLHSDRLAELGTDGVRLVVELVPNADVDLGQYERRRAVIVWSEVEAKPDWWTHEVEWTLLGAYSYEKYKLIWREFMKKELVIKRCSKCQSLVEVLKDCTSDNCSIKCCGEEMIELAPNSVDASFEKHVPNYEAIDNHIIVKVNHVMEEDHFIEWIAMLANNKIIKKFLLPGEEACVIFPYVKGSKIYSFCNKHGLWSKEVE